MKFAGMTGAALYEATGGSTFWNQREDACACGEKTRAFDLDLNQFVCSSECRELAQAEEEIEEESEVPTQ